MANITNTNKLKFVYNKEAIKNALIKPTTVDEAKALLPNQNDVQTILSIVEYILDKVSAKGEELLGIPKVPNTYIEHGNGKQVNYGGWTSTDYIDLDGIREIKVITPTALSWGATYDVNKKYISALTLNPNQIYRVPNNVRYIRTSGATANIENLQFIRQG